MPYERPEFGVVQYEERQFIFAALERHWSWAVGFVGYPVPHFPQSFWQEPAPPMNHAPRTTDFDFSPKVARGAIAEVIRKRLRRMSAEDSYVKMTSRRLRRRRPQTCVEIKFRTPHAIDATP